MAVSVHLTREAFEAAATEWCNAGNQVQDWACKRERYTGHVYMERLGKPVKIRMDSENARPTSWSNEEVIEEPDEASTSIFTTVKDAMTGLADLYVSWSPVYQVPVMYFRVRNAAGSALTLNEILTSSLFHESASESFAKFEAHTLSTALEADDERNEYGHFPAISQGEHPSTGTPCFFLHPCETSTALSDILASDQPSLTPRRILECWFMIVGSVLDLR